LRRLHPSIHFNIKDSRIKELPGVAAHVTVKDNKLTSTGPTLGMSGPAILKLSAWSTHFA
jgi:predicted flavoprotein YhiN